MRPTRRHAMPGIYHLPTADELFDWAWARTLPMVLEFLSIHVEQRIPIDPSLFKRYPTNCYRVRSIQPFSEALFETTSQTQSCLAGCYPSRNVQTHYSCWYNHGVGPWNRQNFDWGFEVLQKLISSRPRRRNKRKDQKAVQLDETALSSWQHFGRCASRRDVLIDICTLFRIVWLLSRAHLRALAEEF